MLAWELTLIRWGQLSAASLGGSGASRSAKKAAGSVADLISAGISGALSTTM